MSDPVAGPPRANLGFATLKRTRARLVSALVVVAFGAGCSANDRSDDSGLTGAAGQMGTGAGGATAHGGTGGRLANGGDGLPNGEPPNQGGGSGPAGHPAGGDTSGVGGTTGAAGGASVGSAGMQPFKGVANSPCAVRTALDVSWYYNWTQTESQPCSAGKGGAFVPMIWGHAGAEQTAAAIASAVASFVGKGYPYVLGFNEPDNTTQSNIAVSKAVSLWPSFANPAIKTVSPATQANTTGQAWFTTFMGDVNANTSGLRTDVMALHWYGWNAGSCDASASQLGSYLGWAEKFAGDRPIWLTEWGCLNQSAPDAQTVVTFFKAALAQFAKHPRVERYAWYPWSTNLGLANADGSLTALGQVYAAAPAYK
jgi:putative glycosyl hydrolase